MTRHSYSLTYRKQGEYWHIEAVSEAGLIIACLAHLEGEGRPYHVYWPATGREYYPTYAEACSVFMNILRRGR